MYWQDYREGDYRMGSKDKKFKKGAEFHSAYIFTKNSKKSKPYLYNLWYNLERDYTCDRMKT